MDNGTLISEGLRAFAQIKRNTQRNFDSWLAVGRGLEAGRTVLMQRLKLNAIDDSAVGRKAYNVWLKQSGYNAVPNEARRVLRRILDPEHLLEIEKWYERLTEKQKLRWNHPSTIWANWRRETDDVTPKRDRPLVTMSIGSDAVIRKIRAESDVHDCEYIALAADIVRFLDERNGGRGKTKIMQAINDQLRNCP
jgi:hypothetical protein